MRIRTFKRTLSTLCLVVGWLSLSVLITYTTLFVIAMENLKLDRIAGELHARSDTRFWSPDASPSSWIVAILIGSMVALILILMLKTIIEEHKQS